MKLRAHQEHILEQSYFYDNLFLWWGMGSGKTFATATILEMWKPRNTLIFAPKAVLFHWQRELDRVGLKSTVLIGSTAQKLKTLEDAESIVITNYESLRSEKMRCALHTLWECLVCDESHMLKSPKGIQSKNVLKIAEGTAHTVMLTGTVFTNSIADVWMQFKIFQANRKRGCLFPGKFTLFRNAYMYDVNADRRASMGRYFPNWQARRGAEEEIGGLIDKYIDKVKTEECLDLPPLIKTKHEVTLDDYPEVKKAYKEMRREYITYIKDELEQKERAVVATLAVTKMLKLHQIANGFYVDDNGEEVAFRKHPKLDELRRLLTTIDKKEKIVIWACYKKNYQQIKELCDEIGIESTMLTGLTKDKQGSIDKFIKDPQCRVIICNQKAGGTGVDGLQVSRTAIYYSKNYNYGDDIQSEARTYRGGSEIHERVYRIDLACRGSVDGNIEEAIEKKQKLSDVILDWEV